MLSFSSSGKFLISGEYLILQGARGLALPLTKMKQHLCVRPQKDLFLTWQSFNEKDETWFELKLDLRDFSIQKTNSEPMALTLKKILEEIKSERPELFKEGLDLVTTMNFSPEWGLGSSSTLISLLSQWANLDPFPLQKKIFGGSGYDIACATATSALFYSVEKGLPKVQMTEWTPSFAGNLLFIYLGQKKNSRNAISEFKEKRNALSSGNLPRMNELTETMANAQTLGEFQSLMDAHEAFLAEILDLTPVKEKLFHDFEGSIKSLGGWGGDFVMALSSSPLEETREYFQARGFKLSFSWSDLIQ